MAIKDEAKALKKMSINTSKSQSLEPDSVHNEPKGEKNSIVDTAKQLDSLEIEDSRWKNLDSVHYGAPDRQFSENGNASYDFDDSACSFASFGGNSESDLGSSFSEIMTEKSSFTTLDDEQMAPSRTLRLSKPLGMRPGRAMTYRTELTLIEEKEDL